MSYTFDGINKQIIIDSGTTEVSVQDMYSRWKDWVYLTDNSKYEDAFRTFGGDPTITGQFAPSYYFLTNGWRVKVQDGDDVSFGINLYTEEQTTPFILGSEASVTNRNSDAVIVGDQQVRESLDYGSIITIDSLLGISGSEYPVGTPAVPVNNISDAIAIAESRNIHELHIFGPVTFDVDVEGYEIIGGNLLNIITASGVSVANTTFKQCFLQGTMSGRCAGDNIILGDVVGLEGYFQHTGFQSNITIPDGVTCDFIDCFSLVPGNGSPELFLGSNQNISIRRYSGGLSFNNCNTGTTITAEYTGGDCKIQPSCVGGEIEVRGITKLSNNTGGTTIGKNGIVNEMVWNSDVSGNIEGQAGYELTIARLQAALAAALSA